MPSSVLANIIISAIESNTVILTPNHRLAQALNRQISEHHQSQHKTAWYAPTVEPATDWLKSQYLIAQDSGLSQMLLLSAFQEQALWQQLLSESSSGANSSLAGALQKAWNLTQQWLVASETTHFYTADHQLFKQINQQFEQHCNAQNWISENQIHHELVPFFKQQQLNIPSSVLLYCFEEITPALQLMLDTFEKGGCSISRYQPETVPESCHRIAFNSHNDEIKAAAQWSADRLKQQPDAKIGIVIADLANEKATVEHIFAEQFSPEYFLNETEQPSPLYNLSAGTALSKTMIISEALFILELDPRQLSIEQISRLLLSPYLQGHQSESSSRALLDQKLRGAGLRQYSCKALLAQIEFIESRTEQPPNPIFQLFLEQISEQQDHPNHKQPTVESPTRFKQRLEIAGWPGDRTLTSAEYQTVTRFHKKLNDLAQLHIVQENVSYSTALGYLRSMLGQEMYQVSSPDPSIQVLGTLEAAGLQFDYLWVMGLHEQAWPTQAEPNPFLPRSLQREHNLPRSSYERELAFCQKLTRGYQHSARQSVFSYPQLEGESQLTVSPLIRHLEPIEAAQLVGDIEPFFRKLFDHRRDISLHAVADAKAPAIPRDSATRGGSSILRDQSRCPFSAFAIHRLGAIPLDAPEPGIQPTNRGTLLHRSLEIIWEQLQSSENLQKISDPDLQSLIEDAINRSLKPFRQQWPELDQLLFLDTEQVRLQQAILTSLEAEKQRQPFTVLSQEQAQAVQLGELNIRIKIDRIDQLEDGTKACIDYKTGSTISAKDWFGERPQDPQLPLYAIQQQDNLSTLTFQQVLSNETKWQGVTDSAEGFPELKPLEKIKQADFPEDWDKQLQFWRTALTDIAQQFANGDAAVDPFDAPSTCTYCHLKSLCRIPA